MASLRKSIKGIGAVFVGLKWLKIDYADIHNIRALSLIANKRGSNVYYKHYSDKRCVLGLIDGEDHLNEKIDTYKNSISLASVLAEQIDGFWVGLFNLGGVYWLAGGVDRVPLPGLDLLYREKSEALKTLKNIYSKYKVEKLYSSHEFSTVIKGAKCCEVHHFCNVDFSIHTPYETETLFSDRIKLLASQKGKKYFKYSLASLATISSFLIIYSSVKEVGIFDVNYNVEELAVLRSSSIDEWKQSPTMSSLFEACSYFKSLSSVPVPAWTLKNVSCSSKLLKSNYQTITGDFSSLQSSMQIPVVAINRNEAFAEQAHEINEINKSSKPVKSLANHRGFFDKDESLKYYNIKKLNSLTENIAQYSVVFNQITSPKRAARLIDQSGTIIPVHLKYLPQSRKWEMEIKIIINTIKN